RARAVADRAGPVPVSRVGEQVVVRRHQPRRVHRVRWLGRQRRRVVRPEHRGRDRERHRSRGPPLRGRPRPGPDRARPAPPPRHRDRAHRHGRLVLRHRGAAPMSGTPILTEITFAPLVGAIVIALLPARYARPLALATALVAWGLSLLAAANFAPAATGFQ